MRKERTELHWTPVLTCAFSGTSQSPDYVTSVEFSLTCNEYQGGRRGRISVSPGEGPPCELVLETAGHCGGSFGDPPDKRQSIGSFAVCLLERRHGFFFFVQVEVRRGEQEMANILFLCQIKGAIEHLSGFLLLTDAGER